MRYPFIFFDLDGTLTDPTEGITKSVQYALAKFGIESETEQLRSFIGPPLHHSFMNVYGFDEPKARRAVEYYREYFAVTGIFENVLFPGIPELLARLRAPGPALAVVTSKPKPYAEQILRHFELDRFFDSVVGANMEMTNSEKPGLVREAISLLAAADTKPAVMIGDRKHDIFGAIANGIDSIGVTYGAGSREELIAAGATHVVETLAELETLLLP
jgi:phosphoglycolate phosphatase